MATSTLEVRPTSDSHFAWLRTKMSCDRTLMSWVRTAVSMVGFGFTIVQFFDRFKSIEGVKEAAHTGATRLLGMMLIGAGTIGLAISNATRFPALAALIAHVSFPDVRAVPAVVAYLLIAMLLSLPYELWRKRVHARAAREQPSQHDGPVIAVTPGPLPTG